MNHNEKCIDYAAVQHIPLSEYAFAESEHRLVIRIRVRKNDLSACYLYYADRVCKKTPIEFFEIPMKVCATDEYFDYFEAKIESEYNRICYYFKLEKDQEWILYYADRFSRELADIYIGGKIVDERSEYYQYPFILRDEIQDVPEWFKSAVVYNIFPDSFATGKRKFCENKSEKYLENGKVCRSRLGGTINGITENLDYIRDMGFTCIYLNPIFAAGEYHKYDVLDYYHIDPCLGTDEDFQKLVDTLHDMGMKIIIDGVFNHCSWDFFAFEDVVKNGRKSRYCKWFYDLKFPVKKPDNEDEIPNYACFAYERKMPKLNTSEREVQMYFADVGVYWIRKYNVDGWRLDVANEIDCNFWRKFRKAVKEVNPEAILIGEVWESAQSWLRGDMLDSTMNYEFRRVCKDYLTKETPDSLTTAYQFERMRLRYPTNIMNGQLNLIDSHDVPRFLSLCHGSLKKWELACILLLLMPGVPSLFYGDEVALEGCLEKEYRRRMDWNTRETLCGFVQRLISIRKDYIDSDTSHELDWQLIRDGLFAFRRRNQKSEIMVMINAGKEQKIPQLRIRKVLLANEYENDIIGKNGYCICEI